MSAVVMCLVALGGLAVDFQAQAGKARLFPTDQNRPRRIHRGFVSLGEGRIDAGVHRAEDFYWFVAAELREEGSEKGDTCFRSTVIGPLYKGGGPGQNGGGGCLEGTTGEVAFAAPVHRSNTWSEFDVGMAAYEEPVDHVRLLFPDGESKVIPTRRIGRDLSVPGLGSLNYAVFVVSGCVIRAEAEEQGQVVAVTKLPECRSM
jgi:hypothetical protein